MGQRMFSALFLITVGKQTSSFTGAWIQITFAGPTPVSELWVQGRSTSPDVLGQDVYLMTHSRSGSLTQPRRVRLEFSNGSSHEVQLADAPYFQIVVLPEVRETTFLRIVVEDVWPAQGATDAGIGKVRIFSLRHSVDFDISLTLLIRPRAVSLFKLPRFGS